MPHQYSIPGSMLDKNAIRSSIQRKGGNFWAVIPAGGAGTRLWPLSRAARPKFLLPLLGERSLLQQTVDRLLDLTDHEHMMIICGPTHAAEIIRQLPELPTANVIMEPFPSGTLPALALAAALIERQDPEAIMGSFAADHDVADREAFTAALRTAIVTARQGSMVTVGITPTRPETGYGYIERTDEQVLVTDSGTAFRAARFVEKPNLETATEYIESGTFLWNAAMFVWSVASFQRELLRLQPEVHAGIQTILRAWDSGQRERVVAGTWAKMPDVTIDNGIMEHAELVAVVPAEMGWSDVGDWNGLGELIERDALGNSVRGDLLQIDTTNSVIWSETARMVAMVGLDSIIVVDTKDALLVVDRSKSQEVRKVVDQLKKNMRGELS
ncbi:MAG TPA: sugar phosphate nucleotidyltransferase [Thermomicrobiales bacterium]|nr:sugar phosphate nucleotidyltransferase [Thermomicrobiales bacterium]